MKASAISRALRTLVASRQPVFIWGGPGIGKSAIVRHLAATLDLPLQDVRALLLDPVDLRGVELRAAPQCTEPVTEHGRQHGHCDQGRRDPTRAEAGKMPR